MVKMLVRLILITYSSFRYMNIVDLTKKHDVIITIESIIITTKAGSKRLKFKKTP